MTEPDLDVPRDVASLTASLTEHLTHSAIELHVTSAPLDSTAFSSALREACSELLLFTLDLRKLAPNVGSPDDAIPVPVLSTAEHGSWPPHRRQTLEILRVVDLLRKHADDYYLADTEEDKTAALGDLIELALFAGVTFGYTSRLMAARAAYRMTPSLTLLAAELSTTPDQVKRMLADADALITGPPPPSPPTSTATPPTHGGRALLAGLTVLISIAALRHLRRSANRGGCR